jgi:hypothetical protein
MGAIRQFPRRQELTLNFSEQGGQAERRIGRILKSKVLGRRRVTVVVRLPEDSRCISKNA